MDEATLDNTIALIGMVLMIIGLAGMTWPHDKN